MPKVDENTVIKTKGPEQGVPHFFVDQDDIAKLFADFELVKVRHIDDCYEEGKWKIQKHYFIEAKVEKQAISHDYSDIIGKRVDCKIDRPLGTVHPRHPDLKYEVNYGYVEGVIGGDGEEQDVYILGVTEPLKEFSGKVIAVYHRLNDNEDKWIVAHEGAKFSREEILSKIEFQEKFFDGDLYL
jgi:inorganic pyrophosphatase